MVKLKSVTACRLSPDGAWMLLASLDGTLRIWDVDKEIELLALRGSTEWIDAFAISPDRNWIISTSSGNTLKVWDVHTGTECSTLRGHIDEI